MVTKYKREKMDQTYKQLKDVGFPLLRAMGSISNGIIEIDGLKYLEPNLSELIEACGYKFKALSLDNSTVINSNKWVAYRNTDSDSGTSERAAWCYGSTPEGAVANLWLELNKK